MSDEVSTEPQQDNERQQRLIVTVALLSLLIFLLIALLMIGIPYLNANLVRGWGVGSQELATWQITALISMVGFLIAGVFIITAFRVDSTAKHTASVEAKHTASVAARDVLGREVGGAKKKMRRASDKLKKVVDQGETDIETAVTEGKSAFEKAVQDAEAAIESEAERFRQATQVAIAESDREYRQSIDRIREDSGAVREFIDERAPGVVRESFTAEQIEAIQERVADRLTAELVAESVANAMQEILEKQPEQLVDPVVRKVTAMSRLRWLFRRESRPEG